MPWSFWTSYLLKLGVVGLLLATLYAGASGLRRLRLFGRGANRNVSVIETALLSQNAAVHLLKVGTRYFLVGTAAAGIATLAELAPADLTRADARR